MNLQSLLLTFLVCAAAPIEVCVKWTSMMEHWNQNAFQKKDQYNILYVYDLNLSCKTC